MHGPYELFPPYHPCLLRTRKLIDCSKSWPEYLTSANLPVEGSVYNHSDVQVSNSYKIKNYG